VTRAPRAELEVLVERATLQARVEHLGSLLAAEYSARRPPVLAIGILKGSAIFLADLVRAMAVDVEVDFMSISSYERDSGVTSGIVRILKDLERDVTGRDVLIVEDIVDTGLTLSYLRKTLAARRPASLATVALLDRVARRIVPVPIEHSGFEIPDVFVVGYGLDWRGRFRNLQEILALGDPARSEGERLLRRRLGGRNYADDQ
jgi:hypoxanthine phosphoribosyltransferase